MSFGFQQTLAELEQTAQRRTPAVKFTFQQIDDVDYAYHSPMHKLMWPGWFGATDKAPHIDLNLNPRVRCVRARFPMLGSTSTWSPAWIVVHSVNETDKVVAG